MTSPEIGALRLASQRVSGARFGSAIEVVRWMGAIQAQDYAASLWAIGLRTTCLTEADIEAAVARAEILRTWPMRGTLHFVPAEDARWMVDLMASRVLAGLDARTRQLELDDAQFARAAGLFVAALEGGKLLTRQAMYDVLEAGGLSTEGQRGYHMLGRLAQQGLLCVGPRDGKQQTFALFHEWAPNQRRLERDQALAELAHRYVVSHGPVTEKDFARWTGLTLKDVRQGLRDAGDALIKRTIDGTEYWLDRDAAPAGIAEVHLLPGFDEFLLGYQDRSTVLAPEQANHVVPGNNGVFAATVVSGGVVAGTWRRSQRKSGTVITPRLFEGHAIAPGEFAAPAARYGTFLATQTTVAPPEAHG